MTQYFSYEKSKLASPNLGPIRDPGYDPVRFGLVGLRLSLTGVTGFDKFSHSRV
jgi:hypothetical protein